MEESSLEPTTSGPSDTDIEMLDREVDGAPEPEGDPAPDSIEGAQLETGSNASYDTDSSSDLSDVASDEEIEAMRKSGMSTPVMVANHGWNPAIGLNRQE